MSQSESGPTEKPKRGLYGWFEERMGIDALWLTLFKRKIPYGVSWFYTLGFASLGLFIVQAVTGTVLAMYYSPSPDHAYDSIQYINNELIYGSVIRGIHHWGASVMIAVVALHLLVTFFMGAYKYPREFTWVIGMLLLLITLGFGFTGYLLPWDERAYWATVVGTNIAGTVPFIGGALVRLLRGGAELGVLTLTRFYAAHVLLLPMSIALLIGAHLFLVFRQGVSVPPNLWDRWVRGRFPARRAKPAESAVREAEYHESYDHFKGIGHPFFPDNIVEDFLVVVLAMLITVGMAVLVGVSLEPQADPTNTSYVPRPEWYFLFLFQMLKYFPGSIEWIGAVVLPGVVLLALVLLPFFDRNPRRMPTARPIATILMLVLSIAIVLLTVLSFLQSPAQSTQAPGQSTQAPSQSTQAPAQSTQAPGQGSQGSAAPLTQTQQAGLQLVQAQGCVGCHVIGGKGGNVGPALDGVGNRHDAAYIQRQITNPTSNNPSSAMPAFSPQLSDSQIADITQYLLTLK